ncbi:hypothetical protein V8G54_010422 [Vigna mungo]|uniref:Uncharacterized protein n=1 Tax=Vigna mungo TaxID=3915 RepID=A0AAQ3NY02_VIGMU
MIFFETSVVTGGFFCPSNIFDVPTNVFNSAYINHDQQDQLIRALLLASMTIPILTKMVGFDTSHDVWLKLLTYFAYQTHVKIKKLKLQLRTPKQDQSISPYVLKIKKTMDTLLAVGVPLY